MTDSELHCVLFKQFKIRIILHIARKILQFPSVPNFNCQIQPFVIIRSRNLKQIFVLPSSYCLSFTKYSSLRRVTRFSTICYHPEFHGQTNKGTKTQLWYSILYFRNQSLTASQALAPCLSILSLCPLASSIETADRFSWYNNLIYFKVTPTPHFKFYSPSIGYNKMADT